MRYEKSVYENIPSFEEVLFFAQKDERERIQMQKAADSLEDLENRLEGWLTDIENKVAEVNNHAEVTPPQNSLSDILGQLNSTENNLITEITRLKDDLRDNAAKMKEKVSSTLIDKTHIIHSEVICSSLE